MLSNIINIGNSKGIILPQRLLNQCSIENEITIEVKANTIVISSANGHKRTGWAEAFREMAKNGDDMLMIQGMFEGESFAAWTWK